MLRIFLVFLLLSAFTATSLIQADEAETYQEARRLSQSGQILPLQELLQIIQSEQEGRVLELEFEREGGRYLYEIEILDDRGAVWEFKVDAVSGEILERELED